MKPVPPFNAATGRFRRGVAEKESPCRRSAEGPFFATKTPAFRARPRHGTKTERGSAAIARLPQGKNRSSAHYQQISLCGRHGNRPGFEAWPRRLAQGKYSLTGRCCGGRHPGLRLGAHMIRLISRTLRRGRISGLYSSPAIVDGRYGGMILLVGLRPSRRPRPFACPSWRFD